MESRELEGRELEGRELESRESESREVLYPSRSSKLGLVPLRRWSSAAAAGILGAGVNGLRSM